MKEKILRVPIWLEALLTAVPGWGLLFVELCVVVKIHHIYRHGDREVRRKLFGSSGWFLLGFIMVAILAAVLENAIGETLLHFWLVSALAGLVSVTWEAVFYRKLAGEPSVAKRSGFRKPSWAKMAWITIACVFVVLVVPAIIAGALFSKASRYQPYPKDGEVYYLAEGILPENLKRGKLSFILSADGTSIRDVRLESDRLNFDYENKSYTIGGDTVFSRESFPLDENASAEIFIEDSRFVITVWPDRATCLLEYAYAWDHWDNHGGHDVGRHAFPAKEVTLYAMSVE